MLSQHQEFQRVQHQYFPMSVTSLAIWWHWHFFFSLKEIVSRKNNPSKIFCWEKKTFKSFIRHDISSKKLWLSQNYSKQPVTEPRDPCARQELRKGVCSLPSHHLYLPHPLKAVGYSSITHLTQSYACYRCRNFHPCHSWQLLGPSFNSGSKMNYNQCRQSAWKCTRQYVIVHHPTFTT